VLIALLSLKLKQQLLFKSKVACYHTLSFIWSRHSCRYCFVWKISFVLLL